MLPVHMRTEQLEWNNMYNISKDNASDYMIHVSSQFEKNYLISMLPGIPRRLLLHREFIFLALNMINIPV